MKWEEEGRLWSKGEAIENIASIIRTMAKICAMQDGIVKKLDMLSTRIGKAEENAEERKEVEKLRLQIEDAMDEVRQSGYRFADLNAWDVTDRVFDYIRRH